MHDGARVALISIKDATTQEPDAAVRLRDSPVLARIIKFGCGEGDIARTGNG